MSLSCCAFRLACSPVPRYNASWFFFQVNDMRLMVLAVLIALTLTACGQKGGLYIPQDEPPAKQDQKSSGK
jgi:predicted small lipoprotein YifL